MLWDQSLGLETGIAETCCSGIRISPCTFFYAIACQEELAIIESHVSWLSVANAQTYLQAFVRQIVVLAQAPTHSIADAALTTDDFTMPGNRIRTRHESWLRLLRAALPAFVRQAVELMLYHPGEAGSGAMDGRVCTAYQDAIFTSGRN